MKRIFTILALLTFTLSACSKEIVEIKPKVARYITNEVSEDEIFDLKKENIQASFEKYAQSETKNQASIISQTTGLITDLKVEIGSTVKKNQSIATIGNSLVTDINSKQIESSNNSLQIIEESKNNTVKLSQISIESAEIGINTAYESYKNATQQLKNSENLYDIQYDSANNAYKTAKNNYYDAEDALDNFKLNNFDAEKISEMEAQVKVLKNAYKQSKYALEQVEEGQNSQQDQLKYAIDIAENQYKLAQEQYNSAKLASNSQLIGIDSQVNQINSAKDLLVLNQKYNTIKSPINGVVTELFIKKNSFTGSGQSIAKIEDPSEIILKTSLNESELKLISLYDNVELINEDVQLTGKINRISPTPNVNTKKTEIEISLPENTDIKSGKMIKIRFTSTKEDSIFIPINAIVLKDNQKTVKILDEKNFIISKDVEIGEIFGNLIEIKNGLTGDEIILAKGQNFFEEGNKIVINKR